MILNLTNNIHLQIQIWLQMLSICYTVVRRQWQFTKASLVWFQEVNRISHYVLFHCSDAY